MPVEFLRSVMQDGTAAIPQWEKIKTYGPSLAALGLIKYYFTGTTNTWERQLHGRVVMVTGGTSGLGAAVAKELAFRGAQVILLVRSTEDGWLQTYIEDLRELTGNIMVYAEECDLGSLYSVRKFATRWLDNSPPRRLDMVVCCAGTAIPPSVPRRATQDGVEEHLQINYLGHYHLLTLLLPSFRSQPPDRDVRIVLTNCVASVMADFDINDLEFTNRGYPQYRSWRVLGASKLALTMFACEFQRRLNSYERKDKLPVNTLVRVVDPGMMRSPSFKRFVSFGSVFGLVVYLLLWPIWWLFLMTSMDGAQSVLYACMSPLEKPNLHDTEYVSNCRVRDRPPRKELSDEALQKELYDYTEKFVLDVEKKAVLARMRKENASESTASANSSAASAKPSTANGSSRKRKTKNQN